MIAYVCWGPTNTNGTTSQNIMLCVCHTRCHFSFLILSICFSIYLHSQLKAAWSNFKPRWYYYFLVGVAAAALRLSFKESLILPYYVVCHSEKVGWCENDSENQCKLISCLHNWKHARINYFVSLRRKLIKSLKFGKNYEKVAKTIDRPRIITIRTDKSTEPKVSTSPN